MGLFNSLVNLGVDVVRTPFSLADDILSADVTITETRENIKDILDDIIRGN